ncbi:MAG: precorrin-2 C(20)-methyltransferase [Verrucomicrobiota bacterium]
MPTKAKLIGISVGPGDPELLTVKGLNALTSCDVLFAPQSRVSDESVARSIIQRYEIPNERFRTIHFEMDRDREALAARYQELAAQMAEELKANKKVGYLTLGDALTYSTWIYTLRAVRELLPEVAIETIPGVTSFSAVAAAAEWPLGEQKQRVLTLPCPDDMTELRAAIESHDIVILMKIGKRLDTVVKLITEMGILDHCALGSRVGMPKEVVFNTLKPDEFTSELGYFSTMLIQQGAKRPR